MSNQPATLLRAMFSNLLGLPFGNTEIFPSYSAEPTQETRTLNRLCIATAWFAFCAWMTNKLGLWNHMAVPGGEIEILVLEEEHEQDENDFTEEETYEQQRQQLQHDLLEGEAHLARTEAWFFLWNDVMLPYFIVAIMLSRWSYAFWNFAATYHVAPTWKNYFVFMFGELGWWDVGTIVCGVVAWELLHLGEVMNVLEEREFHVWIDGVGMRFGAWVGEIVSGFVRDVIGVVVDGGRWFGSMLRRFGEEREGKEVEREWSAWEVEERERRELGLPVHAPGGGWRVRL